MRRRGRTTPGGGAFDEDRAVPGPEVLRATAALHRLRFVGIRDDRERRHVEVAEQTAAATGKGLIAIAHGAFLLVGTDVSAETLAAISRRMADDAGEGSPRALMAGLILGSPEFQRQ